MTEDIGSLYRQVCDIQEIGVGNEVGIRRAGAVSAFFLVQSQPVAVLEAGLPESPVIAVIGNVIDPFVHAGPVLFQDTLVSIDLIDDPGEDDSYIAPGGSAVGLENVGNDMGDPLLKGRFRGDIPHPLRVEEGGISVK